MSLPHAILGFLRDQPMSGYDLKTDCFDKTVAHFWPADQAQIYRTLEKLAEQGFVTNTLEIQEDRPNRKVYHLTDEGRAELDRWLHVPQSLPTHREPFLIQLFFADGLTNAEIVQQLQTQLAAHRALLDTYERIDIPDPESIPPLRRLLELRRMTLDLGKQTERGYIDWITRCMDKLNEL
jgi:PadR family transcriptional regulator, regulatory protein AphA